MTSFETIYKKFLPKITDYTLLQMDDETAIEFMKGWLESAVANISDNTMKNNLTFTDTDFDADLTETEKEVLALGMVEEWLEPQLNSVTLTKQFVGGKGENFFAQSKQLTSLMELSDKTAKKKKKLISDYRTRHNSYLNGES